jgi:hypothetical protein
MRLIIIIPSLVLSASCSCASRPPLGSCEGLQTIDRYRDPCGYADEIGRCYGIPESDRARVLERCRAEIERTRPRLDNEPQAGPCTEAQPGPAR